MSVLRTGTDDRRGLRLSRHQIGLRARLVAIALIPIVGLSFSAISQTVDRSHELLTAEQTADQIDSLVETLKAQAALDAEILPTQAKVSGAAFGVPASMVSRLVGFDIDGRLKVTRPQTDAAFAGPRFAASRAAIKRIRAGADQPALPRPKGETPSSGQLAGGWTEISELVADMRRDDLATLQRTIGTDEALRTSLASLLDAEKVVSGFTATNVNLFELKGDGDERRDLRRKLAINEEAVRTSLESIPKTAGPRTQKALDNLTSDPSFAASETAVNNVLNTPTKPIIADLTGTAETFRLFLSRTEGGASLLAAAASDLRASAKESQRNSQRSLLLTVGLSISLALASLGIALFSARSIINPLLGLARRAERVANGTLDSEHLSESGPKEVRVVTRAMNDLVANLETLDQQVVALAEGELDAEVLKRAVAGDLGTSVRRTIDRLSTSLRSRDELQQRLAHEAAHDPLTQLPNRQAIIQFLDAAIARAARYDEVAACLFIDLDDFKRANDFYGHRFGDEVLVMVGERLRGLIRSVDAVGRLGGDEFVLVADRLARPEDSVALARRVVAELSRPYEFDGKICHIGASVGVALATSTDATTTSLLRDADMAVYRAKRRGRGTVEVFDETLREDMDRRTDIENAFQRALTTDELWVAYQPIVERDDLGESDIRSFEALIRWDRPALGPVPPAEFVPILEDGPQIVELGKFVLRSAIAQLSIWQAEAGGAELSISVNLSGRHLATEGVVGHVLDELSAAGVSPSSLTIELTETALLSDITAMREHLQALRSAGVKIALDDFGTGFTSISQLAILPIDIMKIDRSFTDLIEDPSGRPIVEMMIGVADTLGLTVVAEGVETHRQAKLLAALGCTHHQGWLYGKAVAPEIPDWVPPSVNDHTS